MLPKLKLDVTILVALIVFISIALVIAPFLYVQLLRVLDPITSFLTIVFPIVLSLISGLIFALHLEIKLKDEFNKLGIILNTEKVPYYGTKFNVPKVPDKNTFWLSLLLEAEMEFIVVGRSNKHWIKQGGGRQLSIVGEQILRIVKSGGRVTIVSKNDEQVIQDTKSFFVEFIVNPLSQMSPDRRSSMIAALKDRFVYAVVDHLNYNVVLSDERIMVIPSLNSYEFRDESIVLEIRKAFVSDAYQNYRNDIYNTIRTAPARFFPGDWERDLP